MKRGVCIAIVVMGFTGLVAEILLLRELLIVFSGNELSIGIILANWLLLEASGCFLAGRVVDKVENERATFASVATFFSLFLFVALFLTRVLKNVLGVSIGENLALLPMFYASFLILLPLSLSHGALFTLSCRMYATVSAQDAATAAKVYVYETLGAIVGGVASTYLLIPYLNTFQAASGLAMVNFVTCLILLAPDRRAGWWRKVMIIRKYRGGSPKKNIARWSNGREIWG